MFVAVYVLARIFVCLAGYCHRERAYADHKVRKVVRRAWSMLWSVGVAKKRVAASAGVDGVCVWKGCDVDDGVLAAGCDLELGQRMLGVHQERRALLIAGTDCQ